ncbi:MAG: hypothetical protein PHN76_04120 [Advenella sp.]|uniref:hypothetical protein n=1 Tax=Advenella sp. TaxID=1872388 RepID=UPI0025888EC3|nr:hypothetical protein [Advenella sp.]MDD3757330.1 hypothetical protein [Advenella sp.]
MDTQELQILHEHPDGHAVFYDKEAQALFIQDGDTERYLSIPIGAYGLLELAENAARIAKQIVYEDAA